MCTNLLSVSHLLAAPYIESEIVMSYLRRKLQLLQRTTNNPSMLHFSLGICLIKT